MTMLSFQVPGPLANQLTACCEAAGVSKSSVVQAALQQTATPAAAKSGRAIRASLLAIVGTGNRKYSTDQIMRMTRGAD